MNDLQNIQKFAKMLDGKQLLDTEDLKGFATDIINAFAQMRATNKEITQEHKDVLNLALRQLNAEHDRILEELEQTKRGVNTEMSKALELALSDCKKMCDDVMAMKPKDGEDADDEEIIGKVLEQIKLPEYEVVTTEKTRDGLESLVGNERLDIKAIKGVEDFIKGLKLTGNKVMGGGARLLSSLFDVIIDTPTDGQVLTYNSTTGKWGNENASGGSYSILTATGTIDDSNTAFDFTSKPTEIVLNGLSYIENGGWTWAGSTATLTNPVGSGGAIYGRI